MPRLTVLIPCKDERRNIRACIESARPIADEILIADSGSKDDTLELVRQAGGCRVIEREYINSANFKNWAIPQAVHGWVMVLDSDERVTPELAAEIKTLLQSEPAHDGYWLRRDFYFLGHLIKHGSWETSRLVRLFRRDCRYANVRVHSDVVVPSGRLGTLKGRLQHFSANDLSHFIERQHRYSTWSALDSHEKGKRIGLLKMLAHGPLAFLQQYLLRGVFLDGVPGLAVCGLHGYYTFLKDLKIWALSNDRSPEERSAAQRFAESAREFKHQRAA